MNASLNLPIRNKYASPVKTLVLWGAVYLLGACAPSQGGNYLGTAIPQTGPVCRANSDQIDSFMAKLNAREPILVSIDPGFNEEEKIKIERAIQEWNAHAVSDLSQPFFRAEVAEIPVDAMPRSADDCNFGGSHAGQFFILRETSNDHWYSLGLTKSNPAVTLRCRQGSWVIRQAVIVNLEFTNRDQFQSIILHELGHALGLNHSCSPESGSAGYAWCKELESTHDYRKAVMYPTLRVGMNVIDEKTGRSKVVNEQKEALGKNDKERTSCLYKGH